MSIKRQIKHKYHNFKFSVQTMALPQWCNSRWLRVGLFSVIFVFGGAYIFTISSSATTGYQIKLLEQKNNELQAEVQRLQVAIADGSSINNIASRVRKLGMVSSGGVKHLSIKTSSEVAKR